MILTYCYRIKPSAEQETVMLHTLVGAFRETPLRRHWNYALGQRLDGLRWTRCRLDSPTETLRERCSLVSEPIGDIPDRCGLEMDRDENAALNILQRALNAVGLIVSACGGQEGTQPLKQEAECWDGVQLALF